MKDNSSNNKGSTLIVVLMFLFFAGVTGYFIYQNQQLQDKIIEVTTPDLPEKAVDLPETETSPEISKPTEPAEEIVVEPSPDPYADWQTYTSQEYGFQFSYPDDFEALDDQNNLYGWPKAVVLLYQGGQAYDIPVEVWDNQAEYQQKYQNRLSEVTVKEVGGKYVTFHNNTGVNLFDEITDSFKEI